MRHSAVHGQPATRSAPTARGHIHHDTGAPLTALRTSSTRWSGFFGTPIVRQAPSSQLGDEMVRMYSYRHREGPGQS
mgnify:CR=1 FL=1